MGYRGELVYGFRRWPLEAGTQIVVGEPLGCDFTPNRLCIPSPYAADVHVDAIDVDGHVTKIDRPATDFLETANPAMKFALGSAEKGRRIKLHLRVGSARPRFSAVLFGE